MAQLVDRKQEREPVEEAGHRLAALKVGAPFRRGKDEARLKVHLGLMDLRDRWNEVEPRLQALVARIRPGDGQRARELLQATREAIDFAAGGEAKQA